ncbi:lipoyl domain-containing protein [Actinoplanes sp. Pm04-4]|uniref:Lipoyl domain-containing protein n=1 Tax=Paractinoplanes pyxinae TaxID=2997416 RepID=A0ABT4BGZ2_9ACTN|nr:lipoyl domain-containing protein [Actinoplanes pyxinae]MCY1145726.1 lipoyl domain-containing protein [Actinoplanes pyxinae]
MQFISSVWRVGLPVVVVASAALVLAAAIRPRRKPAPVSRAVAGLAVLVWLRLAGEAALGEQRPLFERQWKGAAAALLAVAAAVHLWRRCRRPEPTPVDPVSTAYEEPMPVAAATPSPLYQVTMPTLAADVVEVRVTRWLKQVGDRIESGEPLLEVSTDKINVEVPADASGRLYEIRTSPGTTVPTGSIIAVIEQSTAVIP